ncbi:hypothetical protein [Porticoccus sp.]
MNSEKPHFFDKPGNVRLVLRALFACCVLLLALDFVIHRHVYHSWENLWGFYALYGFVGCVLLVLVAKWMRTFLMRDADYYLRREQAADRDEQHSGGHTDDAL